MDPRKLTEVLRATIDPNQRQQAEEHLNQVHKIIGFAPSLLQVVMSNDVEMPVRQAGGIYLKNLIISNWQEWESDNATNNTIPFHIHEQDRAMIREAIVDAVIHAPDLIKAQLALCVSHIVKHDFPGRWTGIVDKVSIFLQNPDTGTWSGALLCLHQLVKNFEYKKPDERGALNEAMQMLLPMIYQRCVHLLSDDSEHSVALQKQILKTFFALVQYFLPLDLISKETFAQWMELVRTVIDRPVPEHTNQVDKDDRPDLIWWKCKKRAHNIVTRIFERYGSPEDVSKEYKEFAEYYLKNFSAGMIDALLKVLDQHRLNVYISPRVLQLTLTYLNVAAIETRGLFSKVSHAFSWKYLKPHMLAIVRDILFPLMCYTDADQELWESDPYEYIRMKFDIFEDFVSPVMAAQTLLHTICKKRKDMLQGSMAFVHSVLTNTSANPRQKDGALHMVGSVADILLKRKLYKDQMEPMLVTHVYPEFVSPHGYLRARACWVLNHMCDVRFKSDQNLIQAVEYTQNCLLNDKELPVKVEAAFGLQLFITSQDKAQKLIEHNIRPIILELLKIIRETENDDLSTVMQRMVCTYTDQVAPIAVEMTQHLAATFTQVIESDEGSSDDKAVTAMGILNTIETILDVMEEQKEILVELEKIVLNVIGLVFTQSVMELYEEVLSLAYILTSTRISPDMWKVFEMMYQMLQKDGIDYFTDMMPALHNYVIIDTPAFLSNENHLLAMFNMCKQVLTSDAGEDPECYAAKLLEVILLQCKGRVDQCVVPFVTLVLERLMKEVKTSELRTMCMLVVIAALQCNPGLLLGTLEALQLPNMTKTVTTSFIEQWIHDTDCFLGLHDRKMCVLGLCTLITLGSEKPQAVVECAPMIVPSLILLFSGLKRAYASKAQAEDDDDSDDDDEDDDNDDDCDVDQVLESDEDDINDEDADYLERLQEKVQSANSPFAITAAIKTDDDDDSDDDDDDDDDDAAETALETYTTPLDSDETVIDEYIVFKEVLQNLQNLDVTWYATLTSNLTPDQQKSIHDIFVLADQRKAAAESKRIEKSGGYVFQNQTVPTTFNFGNALS